MKQNKYFSAGRFARLLRNDLMINQKIYMFAIAGLCIAIYAYTCLIMRTSERFYSSYYTSLFFMYMMGIGVFIGTAFPAFSNPTKASHYLLIPGSSFEKFLVQFLIRIIILVPIALGIFLIGMHLAKATMVYYLVHGLNTATRIDDFHFTKLFRLFGPSSEPQMFILTLFSVSTILFAGSVYFNRFALVKTLIVSAIIVGAVVLSFVLFSHIFYPEVVTGFDFHFEKYKITENLVNIQLAAYLLGGLSWLFFLPLAYFKLKEKEV